MKISIIHPTARIKPRAPFPLGWYGACLQWFDTCESPSDIEYLVVVHESRQFDFWWHNTGLMKERTQPWGNFRVVVNHGRDCIVDQCNTGTLAASGDILVHSMDDLIAPQGWDTAIQKAIPDSSQPVCLACKPREREDLISIPSIGTRALHMAVGPLYPGYEGMFSDNDWSEMARRVGTVKEVPLHFDHPHPLTNGKNQMDEIYEQQNRPESYAIGLKVFEERRAAGFPRVELPGWPKNEAKPGLISRGLDWIENKLAPLSAPPQPQPRYITFCLPGESFRFEWLHGLIDLCAAVGMAGWQIKLCLGYATSCYSTRINMAQEVLDAGAKIRPDYVFWLDDDNIVKPEQFMALVRFLDENPTADVVTGWCWIRQKERWGISVGTQFWTDGFHLCPIELDKLFANGASHKRIAHTGFPCVLMRYAVLEKLGANVFMPMLNPDQPGWFAGEDVAFSLRARDAGVEMWVDPACKVAHLKVCSQEPDIQLYRDSPKDLKDWRAQVNGPAIVAPEWFNQVNEVVK